LRLHGEPAVRRGRAPAAIITQARRRAGASLGFQLFEREPPPGPDGTLHVCGAWGSSGDFFVRVAAGALDREFAGYPGSTAPREPKLSGGRWLRCQYRWNGGPDTLPVFSLVLGGAWEQHLFRSRGGFDSAPEAIVRLELEEAEFRWPSGN